MAIIIAPASLHTIQPACYSHHAIILPLSQPSCCTVTIAATMAHSNSQSHSAGPQHAAGLLQWQRHSQQQQQAE
jgi:hypothetical protein